MNYEHLFHVAAVVCMALAIVAGAVASNAPAFELLWTVKAATAGFTGLAGLFLKPPGSITEVPPAPGSKPTNQ
jgi:hypothetical protein